MDALCATWRGEVQIPSGRRRLLYASDTRVDFFGKKIIIISLNIVGEASRGTIFLEAIRRHQVRSSARRSRPISDGLAKTAVPPAGHSFSEGWCAFHFGSYA